MKPHLEETTFGSITIDGQTFEHDVVIDLDGTVKKRKKKLSKSIYGTSHLMSSDEAKFIFQKGSKRLIIGSGQYGMLKLSDEAANYFAGKRCMITLKPTNEALRAWNEASGAVIGLFHITC